MSQIYEAMVLLDNDVVRQGYDSAKHVVTDTLKKYEANVHAYPVDPDNEDADLVMCDQDDAHAMPKCVVVDHSFNWEGENFWQKPYPNK